jgi:AcrR family transcriptional regulator
LDALTYRRVAAQAGCSTSPVIAAFPNASALAQAALEEINQLFGEHLTAGAAGRPGNPFLGMGLAYVDFAARWPSRFAALFLSDQVGQASFDDLVHENVHAFVFAALGERAGMDAGKARALVTDMWIYVHGMAAFIATNALTAEPADIERRLRAVMKGLLLAATGPAIRPRKDTLDE